MTNHSLDNLDTITHLIGMESNCVGMGPGTRQPTYLNSCGDLIKRYSVETAELSDGCNIPRTS